MPNWCTIQNFKADGISSRLVMILTLAFELFIHNFDTKRKKTE